MNIKDIIIRDPFILADQKSETYYLYGTTNHYDGLGFYCYTSKDLVDWKGPFKVFNTPVDFWGTRDFWAPEVHEYKGAYYMFATFKNPRKCRGVQILKADNPIGPFVVHSDVITPKDWECLDGTLVIESGEPYMIFCHEWLQIKDGTMCSIKLSDDLKHAIGEPTVLFKASDALWSKNPDWSDEPINVTDGPFAYVKDNNKYLLWSSFGEKCYRISVAIPKKSFVEADYIQTEKPFEIESGGHGMIFTNFKGEDLLVVHINNELAGQEHAEFYKLKTENALLEVVKYE